MKKAVIDIGTNSIKFCLAESAKQDGTFEVIKDANDIAKRSHDALRPACVGIRAERERRTSRI